MAYTHDIIIIGAGSGGLNIAGFANQIGLKVLLIDKSDKSIGGDCLNYGCIPSKALIHVAELAKKAQEASQFGLKVSGTINLARVSEYVDSKKDVIKEHENASYFRKKGMDVALGSAIFIDSHTVSVSNKKYSAKKIVIATGSRPRKILTKGSDNIAYHTNETIFSLKKLPSTFVILGAGPIAIEIGQAFQRLGSQVIVIQYNDDFLAKEDTQVSKILLEQLQNEGVKFYFSTKVHEFTNKNTVVVETPDGKKKSIIFDEILVAYGREHNIDSLNLNNAGVRLSDNKQKMIVNDYLQTSVKHIYAIGDVTGGPMFTHAAEAQISVLIQNMFFPFKKKISYDLFSWVTYTDPQIATFGLNEKQLTQRNVPFDTYSIPFTDDDRAIVDESTKGLSKVYISNKRIVGGTMVGKNAGELVQELLLSMSAKRPVSELFTKIYPYPTATRINKRLISSIYAKKLTPGVKKLFRWFY